MDQIALRRIEDHFEAAGGRRLLRRAWLPPRPQRVMVLVHGFGEHSGRYDEMAAWFARHGAAVHAYDHQGHGLSPGRRGHADRFEALLDDLEVFLRLVDAEHPELPRALVGHSMGGLVVTALACERAPQIDWLVTSGAALSVSPDLSGVKLRLARLLRRVAPRMGMDVGLDAEGLSGDPEVVERYLADPLVHGRTTASMGAGMLDAALRTAQRASAVDVPMLLLHGAEDPLCLASGSEAFYAGLRHSEVAGSAIRTYPRLKHEIFNEPEREQVFGDLQGWLEEREAEAEGVARPSGGAGGLAAARGRAAPLVGSEDDGEKEETEEGREVSEAR